MKAILDGAAILVTRPADQSEHLARLVRDAGGEPVLFPALEIEPLGAASAAAVLGHLADFDLVVFVSPNAARLGMPHFAELGRLPARTRVAAVGPGTAAELKKSGVRNIISPQADFDSEGLIEELSGTLLDGRRVLIVRGQGGREFLGEALASRGAKVDYFECYRRVKPQGELQSLLTRPDGLSACLATSSTIVRNLFDMAGTTGRSRLAGLPFFVSHPRVASAAFLHGAESIFVAGNGDAALVTALETWFGRLRPRRTDS